ncbi:MAG: ABC transporter ATP-binding protein [Tissierellales bacterium]|jgi:putative ABC transport system ATP-binding protein|nr:ABC transporter ATP-binding protein [Tissierellales bacterium]
MTKIIEVKNLSKHYFAEDVVIKAVDDISFSIEKEEVVAIIGKSGSGKSTLLNMLSGLDTNTSGEVLVEGLDINQMNDADRTKFRRTRIGFVFQFFNLVPTLTVWENVILTLGLNGNAPEDGFIKEIIADLGLKDKVDMYPNQLSGGEQQRVAIARALSTKPAIILADEPTGNLDSKMSFEVMDMLTKFTKKYRQTLVIVTHDDDIAKMTNRVLVMADGKVVDGELI